MIISSEVIIQAAIVVSFISTLEIKQVMIVIKIAEMEPVSSSLNHGSRETASGSACAGHG